VAAKTPSYLRFDGATNSFANFASPNPVNKTGDLLVTTFVRLLEWPVSNALIWQAYGGTLDQAVGMFWYADQFADTVGGGRGVTGDEYSLGLQFSVTTGPTIEDYVPTATGVPLRLGAIHQLQLAMKYNSGDSKTYVAVFIDGTSAYQDNVNGQIADINADSSPGMRWGGNPLDNFEGLADHERAVMDILQWRWEVDRGLSITSGEVDAPDGVLDPFEELNLNGGVDTGKSSAYFLGAGSGNASADEGVSNTSSGVSLSWADATKVDPQITATGKAEWTFDNVTGYSLRESDAPDVVPQPIFFPVGSRPNPTAGELRLRLHPCIFKEHGDVRSRDWVASTGLTGDDTAHVAFGVEDAKTSNSGGVTSARGDAPNHGGAGAAGQGRWLRAVFYDSGDTTSTMQQRLAFFNGAALEFALGVNVSDASGNYVIRTDATGGVDTGVSRSTGFHELVIVAFRKAGLSDMDVRFYVDRVEVHEELGTTPGDVATPGMRHRADSAAEEGFWDWMSCNVQYGGTPTDFQGLVPASGDVVLPLLQPADGVKFFRSVTVDDEQAGDSSMEAGTITYTFRHSTDGGSSWSSPATLNDSNLQALACAGNGEDVLEVTASFTASMDQVGSGALRGVVLLYEPATSIDFGDDESREADGITLEAA